MDKNRYNEDLSNRLLKFARRALEICSRLPKLPECNVIRKQLSSAATSIGANYEEADGALTKKDVVNKICISRKEASESRYWLRVISGTYLREEALSADIQESQEIRNILSSIINKIRRN